MRSSEALVEKNFCLPVEPSPFAPEWPLSAAQNPLWTCQLTFPATAPKPEFMPMAKPQNDFTLKSGSRQGGSKLEIAATPEYK